MDILGEFGISLLFIAKILAIFALGLYVAFALVVIRQVQLMTDTIDVGFETSIRLLAVGHLIFSLIVLGLAFLIL